MQFKVSDKIRAIHSYSGWFVRGDILDVVDINPPYVTILNNRNMRGSFYHEIFELIVAEPVGPFEMVEPGGTRVVVADWTSAQAKATAIAKQYKTRVKIFKPIVVAEVTVGEPPVEIKIL